MTLPTGYSAGNAMKEALLMLQETVDRNKKPALSVCTPESIASALLETVVMGLSPARKQVYYIVYGSKLTAMRSYMGNVMLAKRLNPQIDEIHSSAVREGEDVEINTVNGVSSLNHTKTFKTTGNPVVGAYAIAVGHGGEVVHSEIMTIDQIHNSWKQSRQKPFLDDGSVKSSSVHGKFPDEMSRRTVINRLCKKLINSGVEQNSVISDMIIENDTAGAQAELGYNVEESANSTSLDFAPEEHVAPEEEAAPVESQAPPEQGDLLPAPDPFGDAPC
ncbi:MAG: recombinase [Candidatus Makaraimicrobium thalassicum]|nr:MAG: recombinase [Candidatus Omnitrophota bacterium]